MPVAVPTSEGLGVTVPALKADGPVTIVVERVDDEEQAMFVHKGGNCFVARAAEVLQFIERLPP